MSTEELRTVTVPNGKRLHLAKGDETLCGKLVLAESKFCFREFRDCWHCQYVRMKMERKLA